MSIRLVNGCGTLPTSLKDGNLLIYSYGNKIAATIPLPFKTKFNGPYSTEFIRYPNVLVITPTDQGDILVLRYDGSYTLYTSDMRPKGFGNYDPDIIMSQVYIDKFGCYREIPEGMKKPRLYEAYLIRYRQTPIINYTCAFHRWTKEVCNLNDPDVLDVFHKGLNLGIAGYPMLDPMQDCLFYEKRLLIPCNDVDVSLPDLQNRIAYSTEYGYSGFNVLARRCPYGEVTRFVQGSFKPPEYIKEMIDTDYLSKPDRSFSGREKETILYQMACVMSRDPSIIFACEISSYVFFTVDDMGTVRNHRTYDITLEEVDYEGERETNIPSAKSKYNMCGYVNSTVMEISEPTVLPRLAHYQGKVYKGNKEILVPPGVTVAQRPDATMKGFVDCVQQKKDILLYTDTYDTLLL